MVCFPYSPKRSFSGSCLHALAPCQPSSPRPPTPQRRQAAFIAVGGRCDCQTWVGGWGPVCGQMQGRWRQRPEAGAPAGSIYRACAGRCAQQCGAPRQTVAAFHKSMASPTGVSSHAATISVPALKSFESTSSTPPPWKEARMRTCWSLLIGEAPNERVCSKRSSNSLIGHYPGLAPNRLHLANSSDESLDADTPHG